MPAADECRGRTRLQGSYCRSCLCWAALAAALPLGRAETTSATTTATATTSTSPNQTGTAPYWRLQIASENFWWEAYVTEFRLYEGDQKQLIDRSRINGIASDTSRRGNVATNAFDNNLTTYWETEIGDSKVGKSVWFRVSPPTRISAISVYSFNGDSRNTIPQFQVQSSTDGVSWTTKWTASDLGPGWKSADESAGVLIITTTTTTTSIGGTRRGETVSAGAIAGIVVGVAALLFLIFFFTMWYWLRSRGRASPAAAAAAAPAGVAKPTSTAVSPSPEALENGEAASKGGGRREPEPPPTYWQSALQGATSFSEQLEPPAEVAHAVAALVESTWVQKKTRDRKGGPMPEGLEVHDVRRIEDSDLWARYSARRRQIREARRGTCATVERLSGTPLRTAAHVAPLNALLESQLNEVYLLHGTTPTGAKGIVSAGFQLTYAGTHKGSMFGKGVYLAECSSKADEYAADEKHEELYYMLLCRVVLGEPLHLTKGGDAVHQLVAEALASGCCDSVLGDREVAVGTYREFVVYDGDQVYPEYLVRYRRRQTTE